MVDKFAIKAAMQSGAPKAEVKASIRAPVPPPPPPIPKAALKRAPVSRDEARSLVFLWYLTGQSGARPTGDPVPEVAGIRAEGDGMPPAFPDMGRKGSTRLRFNEWAQGMWDWWTQHQDAIRSAGVPDPVFGSADSLEAQDRSSFAEGAQHQPYKAEPFGDWYHPEDPNGPAWEGPWPPGDN